MVDFRELLQEEYEEQSRLLKIAVEQMRRLEDVANYRLKYSDSEKKSVTI